MQVAVYDHAAPAAHFIDAGLKDVVQRIDRNALYRYYKMAYSERAFAEEVAANARENGFPYARVVDAESLQEQCTYPCMDGQGGDQPIRKMIFYGYDQDGLRAESRKELDKVARNLKDYPELMIRLEGHADDHGSAAYNQALSERRSEKALAYLQSRGIPAYRMVSKGFGDSQPIAINQFPDGRDAPEGRQFNRRVEIRIVRPGDEALLREVAELRGPRIPWQLKIPVRHIETNDMISAVGRER